MDRLPFGKPVRVVDDKLLKAYRAAHPVCELEGCYRIAGPEPNHLVPRSRGRDDRAENLLSMCGPHHAEWHRGPRRFFFAHRHELLDEARQKVMTALRIE